MGTVNINDVRKSVVSALKLNFPAIKRSAEEIKQGFNEPRFFIKLLSVPHDQELGLRYKRSHSFDIHYFPASATGANEEMHDIAESLHSCLEYITVNGCQCQGKKISHEIIDGVLHFFVSYVLRLRKETTEDFMMQTITQKEEIKDE